MSCRLADGLASSRALLSPSQPFAPTFCTIGSTLGMRWPWRCIALSIRSNFGSGNVVTAWLGPVTVITAGTIQSSWPTWRRSEAMLRSSPGT